MSYSQEQIDFIKQRYGENSRTYKLLMNTLESDDGDDLVVTGSVNLRPGEDEE
tara:strand:+ start:232 stop:390 length:159 start_codon:yes stop_codon:yes gene_type:complete